MALTDHEILTLLQARDQRGLAAMEEKYGTYCQTVSQNILGDRQDSEECVNDAYLAIWDADLSLQPGQLLPYLAKTTRNIALHRLEHRQAQKRDARLTLLLEELGELLPGEHSLEDAIAERALVEAINEFLRHKVKKTARLLFLRRYFWGDSIEELSRAFGFSESKVKSQLHRTRQKLRAHLEERGFHP